MAFTTKFFESAKILFHNSKEDSKSSLVVLRTGLPYQSPFLLQTARSRLICAHIFSVNRSSRPHFRKPAVACRSFLCHSFNITLFYNVFFLSGTFVPGLMISIATLAFLYRISYHTSCCKLGVLTFFLALGTKLRFGPVGIAFQFEYLLSYSLSIEVAGGLTDWTDISSQ